MNKLDENARTMQREYLREWRKRNPQKVREYNAAYWARKAEEAATARKEANHENSGKNDA